MWFKRYTQHFIPLHLYASLLFKWIPMYACMSSASLYFFSVFFFFLFSLLYIGNVYTWGSYNGSNGFSQWKRRKISFRKTFSKSAELLWLEISASIISLPLDVTVATSVFDLVFYFPILFLLFRCLLLFRWWMREFFRTLCFGLYIFSPFLWWREHNFSLSIISRHLVLSINIYFIRLWIRFHLGATV